MNNEPYREFDVREFADYKQDTNRNKGVANIWANKKIRHRAEYMQARVEKLRELYEKCEPCKQAINLYTKKNGRLLSRSRI